MIPNNTPKLPTHMHQLIKFFRIKRPVAKAVSKISYIKYKVNYKIFFIFCKQRKEEKHKRLLKWHLPPQIGGEDIFIYFVSENKNHNFLNAARILF